MVTRAHAKKTKYDISERVAQKSNGIDRIFLTTVIMIVVIGLIMLFSASYPDANYRDNDGLKYIRSQAIFAILGALAMFVTAKVIPYKQYKIWLKPIMIVVFVALVIVLFMPARQGARRWIPLGFTTIQPSEVAKLGVIMYCANVFANAKEKMKNLKYVVITMLPVAAVLGLVVIEPHFSAFLIMGCVVAIMLLAGGFPIRYFLYLLPLVVVGIVIIAFSESYRSARITAWFDPFDPAVYKTTGWQIAQCLYAIGSGGLFGLGFGNSRQKYMYVSEPQNDTIFAIVCEELGLLGAIAIIALFAFLIWRGIKIALDAKDAFGALLVMGIMSLIGVQVFLNIAVVTNLIPATGVPMPFFSSGGSALVVLMAEMGIVLNVSSGGKSLFKK